MNYKDKVTKDASGFVLLSDVVPSIVQEIRYYSTFNFIGERIDGYEEPCSILSKEAARKRNGFLPIDCEWWHFSLEDEPYPDIYFDFPVNSRLVGKL